MVIEINRINNNSDRNLYFYRLFHDNHVYQVSLFAHEDSELKKNDILAKKAFKERILSELILNDDEDLIFEVI